MLLLVQAWSEWSSSGIIKANISINDRGAILPGWHWQNMKPSHGTGVGKKHFKAFHKNKPSYLNMVPNLKRLNRKRRKGRLCKLSAKSQSQTHLHLPDCQSAFNFSRLRVSVPSLSQKPYVISPQTPCAEGSLMIQASVWVAIWAPQAHTPWWAGPMIWVCVWGLLTMDSHRSRIQYRQYSIYYLKMK